MRSIRRVGKPKCNAPSVRFANTSPYRGRKRIRYSLLTIRYSLVPKEPT